MGPLLPWRVRKVISDRLPLLYHLVTNTGTAGNSAEYWDQRLEETWDAREWPTKTSRIRALTRPGHAIVDIGCGNGSILRQLAGHGYRDLSGVEVSDYAVERLRASGINMWRGSIPKLPIPDARFDVVIASQVLEHVIQRRRFVREISRILKPDGRAFIFVPDDCLGPIDECEHVIKYTKDSLGRFLAPTFDIDSIESMRDENFAMSLLFAQVRKPAS